MARSRSTKPAAPEKDALSGEPAADDGIEQDPPDTPSADTPPADERSVDEPPPPEQEDIAPGEVRLHLVKDAVLGNGQRKRGETLGSCHVHPDCTEAEVFEAVKDPRWTEQAPHDSGRGVVFRMARDQANRRKGDELCYVVPADVDANGQPADYTVRECINALRNPQFLGR